jgi:hypothetical protein
MTDTPANRTDAAICRLLAAGPAPTVAIAARIGAPQRTVRHRVFRLRQAGAVVTGTDGLHRLAAPVTPAPVAGPLPARSAPGTDLAVPAQAALAAGPVPVRAVPAPAALAARRLPAPIAGPLPALAAPVVATDQPASDGPPPRHGGHSRARTVLAGAVLGVAVAGGIAVMVRMRRMSPPPPPARPTGFGDAGGPWGWMPGPTW